ncbi:MAG: hypothetical protein PHH67_07680 [Methanosarcina sp.]|nr:hypothetical protein [Methanosarcina sp.]MDD3317841.1 hypothetical protein [Methanosarcina sp.]MDD4306375.1 hypothetical protein [Methanosarcina sp.]MDD4620778.1 hypothetical protein [Methanosarcina sp.]
MVSTNELKELIEYFLPLNVVETEDKFIFSERDRDQKKDEKETNKWEVEKKELDDICLKIDEKN